MVSKLAAVSECQRSMVTVPPAPGVAPAGAVSSSPPPQAAKASDKRITEISRARFIDTVLRRSEAGLFLYPLVVLFDGVVGGFGRGVQGLGGVRAAGEHRLNALIEGFMDLVEGPQHGAQGSRRRHLAAEVQVQGHLEQRVLGDDVLGRRLVDSRMAHWQG